MKETMDLRGGRQLPDKIRSVTLAYANYMLEGDVTSRRAGFYFDVSHTTILRYIHKYLPKISKVRMQQMTKMLARHKRYPYKKEAKCRDMGY